jgi:eukaryotic-like serine/threonine-protein kinase
LDQELLRRTDTLLEAALRLPPAERERFLRQETRSEAALYEGVIRKLAALDATVAMTPETVVADANATVAGLATRLAGRAPKPAPESNEIRRIGNYSIQKLIAQGGMGAVYLATQIGEGFQRTVAFKVVKPELATNAVMQRFLQERQVLAALDHPNIARLLDAGTADDGTPFLAMEYVEGVRIDEYCETKGLHTEERLRLFLTACDAVQYAHQHLIVHRDIKPSNIMVTTEGTAKLLDFGIAKLVTPDDDPAEKMGLTAGGNAPMTPMYASPEQARGDTVTTSTDQYSLAILLYELLTGSLPYEFKVMTAAGVERTICETEPTRPSEAKIQRKLVGGETEQKVRKRLHGELEMILLMALRKEPQRRYTSVHQFAEDIQKHLTGQPVLAHKDTLEYRVRKFVRRHRAGVIAAALAVISLAASSIVSTYFARIAREEKVVAERRFQETRELARYFVTDLDEAIRKGETAARRELVEKGLVYLKRLAGEAAGDPLLQKEVISGYLKMGDIQGNPFGPNLGQIPGARASYEAALAACRQFGRTGDSFRNETALARRKLADLDAYAGKPAEALQEYRAVLGEFSGLDRADVLYQIGWVQAQQGKDSNALASYKEAEKIAGDILTKQPGDKKAREVLARAAERVGETLWHLGDLPQAIENLKAALSIQEERVLAEPENVSARRRVWSGSMILGDVLSASGKKAEAEEAFHSALVNAQLRRKADPMNRQYRIESATTMGRLADLLAGQPSRRVEGRQITAALIETLRPIVEKPGASDIEIDQYAWVVLTTPFLDLRNPQSALPLMELASQKRGGQDPRILDMLALAQFGSGKRDSAIETERKAISLLDPQPSPMRTELEGNLQRFLRSGPAAQKR